LLSVCCMLHAARCTLHAARCMLRAARCMLHAACCTSHCMLHVALHVPRHTSHCMLHVALHVARCMLHAATLHAARCMLHVACCMLHVARCNVARCNVACCTLHAACCMLHVACCMLQRCMLHVACCTLHAACCNVACCTLHALESSRRCAPALGCAAPFAYGHADARAPQFLPQQSEPMRQYSARNDRKRSERACAAGRRPSRSACLLFPALRPRGRRCAQALALAETSTSGSWMDELAKAELESRSKAQVAGSLGCRHHRSSVQSTPLQCNSPRSAVQCSFRQCSAAQRNLVQCSAAQRSAALYGCFALQEPKAVAELAPLVAEVIPFQTVVDSTVPGHSLRRACSV
jgi:hypothetical protein